MLLTSLKLRWLYTIVQLEQDLLTNYFMHVVFVAMVMNIRVEVEVASYSFGESLVHRVCACAGIM